MQAQAGCSLWVPTAGDDWLYTVEIVATHSWLVSAGQVWHVFALRLVSRGVILSKLPASFLSAGIGWLARQACVAAADAVCCPIQNGLGHLLANGKVGYAVHKVCGMVLLRSIDILIKFCEKIIYMYIYIY